MKFYACITALFAFILLAISPASARTHYQRHHSHHTMVTQTVDPGCNIIFPCEGVSPSPRGLKVVKAVGFGVAKPQYEPPASSQLSFGSAVAGRPSRYIAGHLICAVNVGAALAERGIKGTGSALALSYLHWGHSAGGPVPGAVIVSGRRGGGHVAIVSRVENGVVYAWNATGGQSGWREIPYRHHVLDYRIPG